MDTDFRPRSYCGHRLTLGEDFGIRPDADFQVLRPGPCSRRTSLTRIADSEPGRMSAKLSPISSAMRLRIVSALEKSPRSCSSITRSTMLATKVTPLALTACRSQGASSQGLNASRTPGGCSEGNPAKSQRSSIPHASLLGRPGPRIPAARSWWDSGWTGQILHPPGSRPRKALKEIQHPRKPHQTGVKSLLGQSFFNAQLHSFSDISHFLWK